MQLGYLAQELNWVIDLFLFFGGGGGVGTQGGGRGRGRPRERKITTQVIQKGDETHQMKQRNRS